MQDALLVMPSEGDIESVYREHGPRLLRAVIAFTGNQETASDAVSEAFAQALRRGEAIRSPLPWIWRAAFRIAAGELKNRARETVPGKEGSYEVTDAAEEILSALAQLSAMQRGSVVLHHYAGYPAKDVAAILGSTSPAVWVHLSRGRKRLRELLEKDHG